MRPQPRSSSIAPLQRGAALIVMLVIVILGTAALLVSALSSRNIRIEQDKITAGALAQAKEALIGRAVADNESPGSLSCPDTDDNGTAESTVGHPQTPHCPSYIGRLPWRSLGLPDLRDSSGERLWYVLSQNFRDHVISNPINSNSLGTLNVSGTTPASNVVALIFAPGPAISSQSRSSSVSSACSTTGTTILESRCTTNYLEGSNAALNLPPNPNLNFQSADISSSFNDRLMIIRKEDIIPLVESLVTRELSQAFASYLADNANYPHPANFSTPCTPTLPDSCPSDNSQCRGKIPATELNLYATLPWFTNNRWFDVIYYTAGTASLPGGAGGAGGGGGKTAKGKKSGGSGGGGGGGGGVTTCPVGTNGKLNILDTSGAVFTNNASALFFMPGSPLDGVTRTGAGIASTNLSDYFEDAANTNLDDTYAFPGNDSNDLLFILP